MKDERRTRDMEATRQRRRPALAKRSKRLESFSGNERDCLKE